MHQTIQNLLSIQSSIKSKLLELKEKGKTNCQKQDCGRFYNRRNL